MRHYLSKSRLGDSSCNRKVSQCVKKRNKRMFRTSSITCCYLTSWHLWFIEICCNNWSACTHYIVKVLFWNTRQSDLYQTFGGPSVIKLAKLHGIIIVVIQHEVTRPRSQSSLAETHCLFHNSRKCKDKSMHQVSTSLLKNLHSEFDACVSSQYLGIRKMYG